MTLLLHICTIKWNKTESNLAHCFKTDSSIISPFTLLMVNLTLPVPIPNEEKKFLFSHFFVVPQKVF